MRFKRIRVSISLLLVLSVVALRIELSAARLSAEHGLPALDDHRLLSRAPRGRTENLLAPNQVCSHLHLCPMLSYSVRTVGFEPTISSPPNWRDNQTSLRSVGSSPYGSRTHLPALKKRYPVPIDERAVKRGGETVRKVHEKSPVHDTGLLMSQSDSLVSASQTTNGFEH